MWKHRDIVNHKTRFIYRIYSKITINWGTIHALENDFYTKVSRIKRLTDGQLPFPTSEIQFMRQAVGTFVGWLTHRVKSIANEV